MKLKIFIQGQTLRAYLPSVMVADTVNYFSADFIFKNDVWNGLTKYAHFQLGEECYDIPLQDDSIPESAGLNLKAGSWSMHIHGDCFEDGELVQRITTNACFFTVQESGCLDGSAFPSVPPDLAAELLARVVKLEQNGGSGGTGADGKSAYEVAVEHGFEGSEQEWLESLKGADCGIKPIAKTEAMTQPVGVDSEGGLWTISAASGTVLVAASDASDMIKAAAQYVCTGVNDQLVINAAINAVGEGEVRLSGGNFYLTGDIILKDRIILYGRNSVLNVCDEISSTITQAYTAGDTIIHVADASVFVLGQKVSTDAKTGGSYRCHITEIDTENNTVTLDNALFTNQGFAADTYRLISDFSAVWCHEVTGVVIEGLVINGNSKSYGFYDTDYGGNGIIFSYSSQCKAINCTVNNARCHCILVFHSTQCQLLNCVISGDAGATKLGYDIFSGDGGHLVHGCVAKNLSSATAGFQGHKAVNTIFSSCIATGCNAGFSAQESPNNVVITGCEAYDNKYGIKCVAASGKMVHIVGNTIARSAQDGIQIDASANAGDFHIADNIIKDSGQRAIWVLGVNGFSVVGNRVSNCWATNTDASISDKTAINIYGTAKNGFVANNHIALTTTETKGCTCGIAEYSLTGDNNVVVNNVIRGARIAATQKLGANSVFENNHGFA